MHHSMLLSVVFFKRIRKNGLIMTKTYLSFIGVSEAVTLETMIALAKTLFGNTP